MSVLPKFHALPSARLQTARIFGDVRASQNLSPDAGTLSVLFDEESMNFSSGAVAATRTISVPVNCQRRHFRIAVQARVAAEMNVPDSCAFLLSVRAGGVAWPIASLDLASGSSTLQLEGRLPGRTAVLHIALTALLRRPLERGSFVVAHSDFDLRVA